MKPRVLMVGPSEQMPGGMSAVVRSYRTGGLPDHIELRYLSSYEGPGLSRQLRVFGNTLVQCVRAMQRGEVDLLHVHSASRGSFWRKSVLCAVARWFDLPYLFHLHSGEFPLFYEKECAPWAQRWVRHTMRKAARVLVLSAGWRAQCERISADIVFDVAPNPVPVPARRSAPAEGGVILFLGRVREKKGAFDLLRAFPAVLASHPDARLCLAGDGELERARTESAAMGVAGHVDLPGWIDGDTKDAALAAASVFVLPSHFEGVPIGVLEAMACEVPIVATAVGGIPDIVTHQSEALLSEPGDVEALTRHLLMALQDRELRQRLVDAAYQRVQDHEVHRVAEGLAALYRRLVKSASEHKRTEP